MLLNDFYITTDVSGTDNSLTCSLAFNSAHDIFKGHFPDNPVVPGVCMMEIVKELLQQQVQKTLILRSTGNVKFLRLLTPDSQPTVNISWKESDQGYSVKAFFNLGENSSFKLDGQYSML